MTSIRPIAANRRSFDASAYARQASPSAGITLTDHAAHVGAIVDRLRAAGRGPIDLAGHSLGGLTLNAVGESHADDLAWADEMVALLDQFAPAQRTRVADIHASHSPFLSKPNELALVLAQWITQPR